MYATTSIPNQTNAPLLPASRAPSTSYQAVNMPETGSSSQAPQNPSSDFENLLIHLLNNDNDLNNLSQENLDKLLNNLPIESGLKLKSADKVLKDGGKTIKIAPVVSCIAILHIAYLLKADTKKAGTLIIDYFVLAVSLMSWIGGYFMIKSGKSILHQIVLNEFHRRSSPRPEINIDLLISKLIWNPSYYDELSEDIYEVLLENLPES